MPCKIRADSAGHPTSGSLPRSKSLSVGVERLQQTYLSPCGRKYLLVDERWGETTFVGGGRERLFCTVHTCMFFWVGSFGAKRGRATAWSPPLCGVAHRLLFSRVASRPSQTGFILKLRMSARQESPN